MVLICFPLSGFVEENADTDTYIQRERHTEREGEGEEKGGKLR